MPRERACAVCDRAIPADRYLCPGCAARLMGLEETCPGCGALLDAPGCPFCETGEPAPPADALEGIAAAIAWRRLADPFTRGTR